MNAIIKRIFKNYALNESKLLKYGFKLSGGKYVYTAPISDGEFEITVKIDREDIDAEVCEIETGEQYSLFLVDGASGSFVGAVRSAYESVLEEIAKNCFDKYIFKSETAKAVIEYVSKTYGGELEFLWEKFTDNAVWRRQDTKKWYGAILTVSADKFGRAGETVEVLDVRAEPEVIDKIVDGKNYFRGYHMNKKHWLTVVLDGSVAEERIYKMIDKSYGLAVK